MILAPPPSDTERPDVDKMHDGKDGDSLFGEMYCESLLDEMDCEEVDYENELQEKIENDASPWEEAVDCPIETTRAQLPG